MPTIWSAEQVKKKNRNLPGCREINLIGPLHCSHWQWKPDRFTVLNSFMLNCVFWVIKKITSSSSQFHTWICTCRCSAEWANKTATNWSLCWSSCWWGLRLKTRKNHTCGKHISNWESLFVQTSVSSSTCRLPGPSRHNREDPPRRYGGSWPASERG